MALEWESQSAEGLSQFTWKELTLPERPRFIRELLAVPVDGGVHMVGGREPQNLIGESVSWMMESFVPLLDGSRTVADLVRHFPGVDETSLRDVLHLLLMNGMLEAGEDAPPPQQRAELDARWGPQMAFFSRYLRITGRHASRYGSQSTLQQSRVGLVGEPETIRWWASQLASAGIGLVLCAAPAPAGNTEDAVVWDAGDLSAWPDVDLVLAAGDRTCLDGVTRDCMIVRRPLLTLETTTLTLGPLMQPGLSACGTCARLQLAPGEEPAAVTASPELRRLWLQVLVSYATQQVAGHLTGLFHPVITDRMVSWRPDEGRSFTHHSANRLPNCPVCGDPVTPLTTTLPSGHRENLPVLYHRVAMLKPWHLHQPAAMQFHIAPHVTRLGHTAYVEHRWADARELPRTPINLADTAAAILMDARTPPPPSPLTREQLGPLLYLSAGSLSEEAPDGTGYRLRRLTASAGNLGSAEVYLFANSVPGVDPGLYHYLPVNHTLELLQGGQFGDQLAACIPGAGAGEADAVVLIASAVERVAVKYQGRAYFLCLLDAGLMAHRLTLMAERLGLSSTLHRDFADEPLSRLAGLDRHILCPSLTILLNGLHSR